MVSEQLRGAWTMQSLVAQLPLQGALLLAADGIGEARVQALLSVVLVHAGDGARLLRGRTFASRHE